MTVVEGHASEELAAMDRDLRLVWSCEFCQGTDFSEYIYMFYSQSLLRIKQLQENEEREKRRKLEVVLTAV
jgi:hypothetical protein